MTAENEAKGEFSESTDFRVDEAFGKADAQMPGHETASFKPVKRETSVEAPVAAPVAPARTLTKKEREKASTQAWVNLAKYAKRGGIVLAVLLVLAVVAWLIGLLRLGPPSPLANQGWARQLQSAVGLSTTSQSEVAVRAIDLQDAPPTKEVKPIIPEIDTASSVLDKGVDEVSAKSADATGDDQKDAGAEQAEPGSAEGSGDAPSVPRDTEAAQKAYDDARKLLKRKKLGNAIPLLEEAVKADPLHVESVVLLASSYVEAGVLKKAVRALNAFLEIAPSHEEAPRITELLDGYETQAKRGGKKKKRKRKKKKAWIEKTLLPK